MSILKSYTVSKVIKLLIAGSVNSLANVVDLYSAETFRQQIRESDEWKRTAADLWAAMQDYQASAGLDVIMESDASRDDHETELVEA